VSRYPTKQKTDHEVPLGPEVLEMLRTLHDESTGDYVFPGDGKTGHRFDLKSAWPTILKAANITGLRVHDLRHSFASLLISSGASLPLVGAMLGHTQPDTTARYGHLLDDPLRKAAKRVGSIVTQAGEKKAKVIKLRVS
jgi:integrase